MKKLNIHSVIVSWHIKLVSVLAVTFLIFITRLLPAHAYTPPPPVNPQNSAVGLTGSITAPPPSVSATITVPTNGQVFSDLPITVQGICQSNLLIKLFINNVFAGAAECVGNSYKITTSLFNGTNVLVVRDFDALNQQGPDSNTVTVTFNNPNVGAGVGITLTSSFAKRGVSPDSTLTWPIAISGGVPPYALTIDWGDGKPPDLLSQASPGSFNINHSYVSSGIYSVLIKATDQKGNLAYLQLVAVVNGPISQSSSLSSPNNPLSKTSKGTGLSNQTLYIIAGISTAAFVASFWLGSKHRIANIKKKLARGEDFT